MLAILCPASFALQPHPEIAQFEHVAWGANEDAPAGIQAIAQTTDGYLWLGSPEGLYRFDGLTFQRYQAQSELPLPAGDVTSLLALPNGDLWIGFESGAISLLQNGHAVNYGKREGLQIDPVLSLAQDPTGAIWAASDYGLMRLENNQWKTIGRNWNFNGTIARTLFVDRAGTLWVSTGNSILFLSKGARKFHPTGIKVGQVSQVAQAPNGKLWMAETSRSVRPAPLHTRLAPPDNTEIRVGSGAILFGRGGGDLWITTLGDGLRHVSDPEKLRGVYGRLSPHIERYTTGNGMSSNYQLCIFQDRDGNIWVGTDRGLDRFRNTSFIERGELSRNPQAPPPSIQSVVVDGQSYLHWNDLKLAAGAKNIQIHYSIRDLTSPWQIHFRYKLIGFDTRWHDAGKRRTAYYMNLSPGKYQFHVIAGDTAGAWSSHAAVVNFILLPFWYQIPWVQALGSIVFILLLWTLYQLHLRRLQRQFALALETRLDERVRIARELHDTLLQSFHGLMFQFQAARNLLPKRPDAAMDALDKAMVATEQALEEGRDAIHDLRPESAANGDLAELLTVVGQESANIKDVNRGAPKFFMVVEGKRRRLRTTAQDEIYRIGREVIRNAFQHADAGHIEVELRYDEDELRLRVRDDGKGIDATIPGASRRPGHWGLSGIRERAQQLKGQLEFWSETGAGTEVELRVPAAMAYAEKQGDHPLWPFRRKRKP